MNRPTVAICIPTYNQAQFLERAVNSALAQTYPVEVWVSDDASTDETQAIMKRLALEKPQIHYSRHEKNLGISGNPRWILQQSVTEYVVRLDSDDELCSAYVETLVQALQNHPSAGYGHAAVQEINEAGRNQKLRRLARMETLHDDEKSLQASVTGYRVAANICMFRREALKQVDYYCKGLNFSEDWDLAIRIADAGWGNIYINEVLAKYRVWDTAGEARSRRKLIEVEGCRRVIEESLIPAFKRRNWSLAPIARARRNIALTHSESLRSDLFNENEQHDLKQALRELGDSLRLRLKLRWIRTPLAPLVQFPETAASFAKARAKAILFRQQR
jgi:glycosyltransferase involved in cell wall biosynthesis